ncbi:MAG: hypothetical protein ABIJ92_05495 [Candidatus Aenigmatarchaeota archaeon]
MPTDQVISPEWSRKDRLSLDLCRTIEREEDLIEYAMRLATDYHGDDTRTNGSSWKGYLRELVGMYSSFLALGEERESYPGVTRYGKTPVSKEDKYRRNEAIAAAWLSEIDPEKIPTYSSYDFGRVVKALRDRSFGRDVTINRLLRPTFKPSRTSRHVSYIVGRTKYSESNDSYSNYSDFITRLFELKEDGTLVKLLGREEQIEDLTILAAILKLTSRLKNTFPKEPFDDTRFSSEYNGMGDASSSALAEFYIHHGLLEVFAAQNNFRPNVQTFLEAKRKQFNGARLANAIDDMSFYFILAEDLVLRLPDDRLIKREDVKRELTCGYENALAVTEELWTDLSGVGEGPDFSVDDFIDHVLPNMGANKDRDPEKSRDRILPTLMRSRTKTKRIVTVATGK